MGSAMTLAAGREFSQESCRMRNAVTVFTFWNHFMCILVTGGTGKIRMFDLAVNEQIVSGVMTGGTLC